MTQDRNRERQRELYGAPLVEIATRIAQAFSFTQAKLATVIGVSAPMLSQVLSGRRTKLGNPATVARLAALNSLVDISGGLTEDEIAARIAEIQASSTDLTTTTVNLVAELRTLASPEELLRVASLTQSPALADALRAAAERHG